MCPLKAGQDDLRLDGGALGQDSLGISKILGPQRCDQLAPQLVGVVVMLAKEYPPFEGGGERDDREREEQIKHPRTSQEGNLQQSIYQHGYLTSGPTRPAIAN